MIYKIKFVNGGYTLVDKRDYEKYHHLAWHANARGYAEHCQYLRIVAGKQTVKSMLLHRLIMNTPTGLHTDHINGDKLDNRSSNLRICTRSQNQWNRKVTKNSKSGAVGVTWNKQAQRWTARITVEGQKIFLGKFTDLKQAVKTRDQAAMKYHGEFARLSKGVY